MNFHDEPLAYFITWTVYGTFLQGDSRWWRKRVGGAQQPQPLLQSWHRQRLNHDVILLNAAHRHAAEMEMSRHCELRSWKLWAASVRQNHVHVVVTAFGYPANKVRDQLKANCTRAIRQIDPQFIDRPVWTSKGDMQDVKREEELERVIDYVSVAQDRMGRGK